MKILIISNRIPYPLKDGGAIAIYNHLKGFKEAGCKVTFFALNPKKHWVDPAVVQKELSGLARVETEFIDTDVKPLDAFLNLFSKKSYNVQRFYSKSFERKLVELLQEEEFDVIQFEMPFVAMYLDSVRKYSHAKVVLRQHNVENRIWFRLAENEKNPLKKWYLNLLAKRLKDHELFYLNKFDAIIPITSEDANQFEAMGCSVPQFVSPAGIDTQRLFPDHSKEQFPSLFHIGSLDWIPNQQAIHWFLDNVWEGVTAKYPDLKFYVAGRNMPESMKNMRVRNVEMVGEVEDAVSFMKSGSLMVVPLKAGSGIRIKILEGMALGKAIVSTSIGAQGLDYEADKHMLIADTPGQFLDCISRCVDDRGFSLSLGNNARELVEKKYSNNALVGELLEFYRKLISGN